jgi:hypothetical protein
VQLAAPVADTLLIGALIDPCWRYLYWAGSFVLQVVILVLYQRSFKWWYRVVSINATKIWDAIGVVWMVRSRFKTQIWRSSRANRIMMDAVLGLVHPWQINSRACCMNVCPIQSEIMTFLNHWYFGHLLLVGVKTEWILSNSSETIFVFICFSEWMA